MNQTGRVRLEQAAIVRGRAVVAGGRAAALLPADETPPWEAPATVLVLSRSPERWADGEWWAAEVRPGGDGAGDVVEEPWQRAEREQGAIYG